jgi:nicotinate-nucleotide adenylyltransferase
MNCMDLPSESILPHTVAGLRRVAFYGGSFDPPHLAHLAIARAAQLALQLDCVLFAPVGSQPLKPDGASASFEHRVAMTRLAIAHEEGFAVSLIDAPQPGRRPNYTIDSLSALRAEVGPECELFCLMGADSLAHLHLWHRAAEIPFSATLVVASRPGENISDLRDLLPAGVSVLPLPSAARSGGSVALVGYRLSDSKGRAASLFLLPNLDHLTSASAVREAFRIGFRNAIAEIPETVADYIQKHRLYR